MPAELRDNPWPHPTQLLLFDGCVLTFPCPSPAYCLSLHSKDTFPPLLLSHELFKSRARLVRGCDTNVFPHFMRGGPRKEPQTAAPVLTLNWSRFPCASGSSAQGTHGCG